MPASLAASDLEANNFFDYAAVKAKGLQRPAGQSAPVLFYSMADLLVVGRFVGETGLAAVSSASTLCFLLNAVCMGFFRRWDGPHRLARGAGDRLEGGGRRRAVPAGAGGLRPADGGRPALLLPAVHPDGPAFPGYGGRLRLYGHPLLGHPFVFGYNAVCAILKGRGDSRGPLRFVAAAAVVNLLLDLILAGPCGLGTAGTAWATVAAQGVSLSALSGPPAPLCPPLPPASPLRPAALLSLLRLGLPSAVQMAVVNLSYLILTGLLNPFGVSVAAAAGIGLKVSTFAGMPCWALGYGVTAMVGQNLGAGDPDRVRQAVRSGLLLSLGPLPF